MSIRSQIDLDKLLDCFDRLLSVSIEEGWVKSYESVSELEAVAIRLKELSGLVALEAMDLKRDLNDG